MTPRDKVRSLGKQYVQQARETKAFGELLLEVADTVDDDRLEAITDALEKEGVTDTNGQLAYRANTLRRTAN